MSLWKRRQVQALLPLEREQSRSGLEAALAVLDGDGTGTKAVLAYYRTLNQDAEKVGVCHDLATGMVQGLLRVKLDAGWEWCRGPVDGGVAHSWVEYRGWGVDMDNAGCLRKWATSRPPFAIDGEVLRKDPAKTLEWVEEVEEQEPAARLPPQS
jgi:hypothetical protein